MKPILFNTDMVLAILDGRKTATRRAIKPKYRNGEGGFQVCWQKENPTAKWVGKMDEDEGSFDPPRYVNHPYRSGDILYVRETWAPMYPDDTSNDVVGYMFRADEGRMNEEEYDSKYPNGKNWTWPGIWRPSIHMPKEAARIFLRVTDIKVERLQDVTVDDCVAEGIELCRSPLDGSLQYDPALDFARLWDSTIKPSDRDLYGWDANPWVWVTEFEKISKEEAL